MKNKIILLACTSLFFFSCKKEMKKEEVKADSIAVADTKATDMHNSQNSLDWQGTYKGITPCADCEGIETEVVLNKDMTFIIKTKYLGKGDSKTFEEKGTFVWDKTGGIISLKELKDKPNQYKVGENRLMQLDMEGKVIIGETARMYVLKK
ncbi:copper resistance protein NlpE [Flavobacterium sp. GNP002]